MRLRLAIVLLILGAFAAIGRSRQGKASLAAPPVVEASDPTAAAVPVAASTRPELPAAPISAAPSEGGAMALRDGPVVAIFRPDGIAIGAVDGARGLGWSLRWGVDGARNVEPLADGELGARVSHFRGQPSEWSVGRPAYAGVLYPDVLPGVDLRVESRPRGLEYSFQVAPGADAARLRMRYEGATEVRVSGNGDAVEIVTGLGRLHESGLLAYQDLPEGRRRVAARYRSAGPDAYAIELGAYDTSKPLVVDPLISWATYVGGHRSRNKFSAGEDGRSIAIGPDGNLLVVGSTESVDFGTPGAFDASYQTGDGFVAKVRGDGTGIAWVSHLGPAALLAVAVDSAGAVYVTGFTGQDGFPTTPGAYQPARNGTENAVVAKLSADGASLLWSTYLGGNMIDHTKAIAVDAAGQAYVAGETYSGTFPVVGTLDSGFDHTGQAFVSKFAPNGGSLVWSARIGGATDFPSRRYDSARGVAVDGSGNVFLTGVTQSPTFPTTSRALDRTFAGGADAFALKLSSSGTTIVWSTLLGGTQDEEGRGIAIDGTGAVYLAGITSSFDFPTKAAAQTANRGEWDAYVSKLDNSGSRLLWSTYLGGESSETVAGLAVDTSRNVFVAGMTRSYAFPTPGGFRPQNTGLLEGYAAKLTSGGALAWGTYLGGSWDDIAAGLAVDAAGRAYVTGSTSSTDFPLSQAFDGTLGGVSDAFVMRILPGGGLDWSSFLGGESVFANDQVRALAVDPDGNVYVAGETYATDFPATPGAFSTSKHDASDEWPAKADAFVAKISSLGGLVWATYLGGAGEETARAIAFDSLRQVVVTGTTQSWDFPATAGAYQTQTDGHEIYVAKLNSAGTGLLWSTFFGGITGADSAEALVIAPSGDVVLAGRAESVDFPALDGFDASVSGPSEAFVARLSAPGSTLQWCTLLGGGYLDAARAVALDASENVLVAGDTASADFPASGGFDATFAGNTEGFVAKISANGRRLVWSSFLGGGADDAVLDLAVDASNHVTVVGTTSSFDFPTTLGAFSRTFRGGPSDAFVTRISSRGSLTWSTYLGGTGSDAATAVAVDDAGIPYVAGTTSSAEFPLASPFDALLDGYSDAFLTRLSANGASLSWSTYLGGSGQEEISGIGLDGSGGVFVGGLTDSPDLGSGGGFDATLGPVFDGFVLRLQP